MSSNESASLIITIGGPAWTPKETTLFIWERLKIISDCFSNGPLETRIIGDEIGKASAPARYAAYSSE
ncbi:MAG: hypothetical protein U0V48_00695 [Anaerolineales bacterium]